MSDTMFVYLMAFVFISIMFTKGVILALEIKSNNKLIKALKESKARSRPPEATLNEPAD